MKKSAAAALVLMVLLFGALSEYFFTAERMPAGIPTTQAKRAAQKARTRVLGKAPRMSDVTGRFSL